MIDIAKVIKVRNNKVILEVQPSDDCESCNACSSTTDAKVKSLTLTNIIGAKEGDFVVVEISELKSIQLSTLVYLFPLVMMVLGYFLGELLTRGEVPSDDNPFAVGLSIVCLVISFLVIYLIDKKSKNFTPHITGFYRK